MTILELFSYGFMQRALLAGILIGVLCAVLGVFLVLRRLSLIGDGLAHITFGSVALALFAGLQGAAMLLVSLPVVLLASLGILKLAGKARLGGDAAIGIVSSVGVSLGVLLAVLGRGYGVDLFSYLFGSILAISQAELLVAGGLFVTVMALLWLYYNDLVALTFNEELATVSGVRVRFLNGLLAALTALTVVLAMKLVGVMLISALLILPASAALQVARGFRMTVILSVLFSLVAVVGGIMISFLFNLPSGATIILLAFVIFCSGYLFRQLQTVKNRS
ncbi:MAG: metal ABC transporter permease [Trichlorobacter sp.]|uniref:metal ABC transporter permease n=1 Tax=Trichlorobacter sp. TaxID=2911007 RepID=UPI00256B7502|nr:metal ABC transporter permease [Trichlorobacter sp.]MDK9716923.1 metal ABC transporter permease [Trichlorobacter sp.]